MKRTTLKNRLICILSVFLFIAALGFSATLFGGLKSVKASGEEAWKTDVFEMEDGASLRLSEQGGLRFVVKMDESVKNFVVENDGAELGFVIAPKNLMLEADGDYLNMPKKVGGAVDKDKIYDEEDSEFWYANGCITNVLPANFIRDFVAIAYIQYNGEVRYTDYNDYARNNLYDTVNMATLNGYAEEVFSYATYTGTDDPTDDNTGWYGSEEYPILVETVEEYDALIAQINEKEIDLSTYTVVVKNEIKPTEVIVNSNFEPTFIDYSLDEVNKLIARLPESISMPDAIGVIGRIREVEAKYQALTDENRAKVENHVKLEGLLSVIEKYDRVYKNDADDGTVIASTVPNYTSTLGGTATTRSDDVYGNVLTVNSDANGKAQLHYINFPSIDLYEKIYFYVKVSEGCNLYLSDGIANDGWGENWKNTWSVDGLWCNSDVWKLVEIIPDDGYIGTDFAIGFRSDNIGFTFEISDFYGLSADETVTTTLSFGTKAATEEVYEGSAVYSLTREQWYIDNNNTNTVGTLQQSKLVNALPSDYEYFYFWMYNGTGVEYNFHLAGDVSGNWTDSVDTYALKPGEWTRIYINPADIEYNKNGQWYVYILGGDGAGAAKDGWKITDIFAGPVIEKGFLDHADVKNVIAVIDALPETVTLSEKAQIEFARSAYDSLHDKQKTLVTNISDLESAESQIVNIEKANEVIQLIDSINPRAIDEGLVKSARTAYEALSDEQKALVTNIDDLTDYEEEISFISAASNVNEMIASLPDSVVMPDNLVFVSRIEASRDAYEALSEDGKGLIENYEKLRNLVIAIKGYETVYAQTLEGVSVIPSHVPNYTSTVGGSATVGYDAYYGNYLKVTPYSGGKVAIQYSDFPSVTKYSKIFFNIRVVGASCDIYLSDGTTNDGWGEGWHNTWSMTGFWANSGSWIQKEVAASTGIFSSDWALGLRTEATDVSFEITDIIGYYPDLGTATNLTFGNFVSTDSVNEFGTVYNFTQGWSSDTDMGAFNQTALSGSLVDGSDALHFWIYNPNEGSVDMNITGDMNSWTPEGDYSTSLPSKVWTEVKLTPEIVAQGDNGTWFVNVTTGAGTAGWQISPIYAYSSSAAALDAISGVQARIDGLNTETVDESQVSLAREQYEKLSEAEKALVTIDNLINCETKLYGDVLNAPFIADGTTKYKIYVDQTESYYASAIKESGAFMNDHINAVAGVKLQVVTQKPTTITKYRYAIALGYRDLAEELGLEINDDDLGYGYVIKKVGRVVFIISNEVDGYRMGVLAFLREVAGYDMIAEDCVIYDESKIAVLPELDLVEKPSFEFRQQQSCMTEEEIYGMGMQSHTDIWIPSSEGWDMHNALHYIPVDAYGSDHPSWYTSDKTQPCPTAGGDTVEYQAMVEVISAGMIERIKAFPTIKNISYSIDDSAGDDACTCTRCKLYVTLYGSFSAAWVDLMNDINANIQAYLAENEPCRSVNVAFLAYRSTESAPAIVNSDGSVTLKKRYQINEDGSYTITDKDFKCDEGVTVWLAPIDALYAESFNFTDNAAHLDTVKRWCAISDSVYVWMYGTNFKFYMYPYNSWKASAENYKIFADLGVKAVWSQSNETVATAFSHLKNYIDAKFMADVNSNYEAVLNTYFTNYFGAGAEKMRTMFDNIVARCEEIESDYDGLGRGIYDVIENTSGFLGIGGTKYWTKDWLDSLLTLCDEAKAAVDADTSLTDEQKTAIKNRITKESIFPRYVLCTTFASSYSSSNKKSMRQAFKADCDALGFTLYREADGYLSDLYSDWNL